MRDDVDKWQLLGERLLIARRRSGLSAKVVAERAGTSRITISRLENTSKPHVSFDVLWRIAEVLGVSLDYLAGRKDEDTVVRSGALALAGTE